MSNIRIGFSKDIHPLTKKRKLILGGVDIPFNKGLDGHSDADVLTHAVCESLLGALNLGDLGSNFPDNSPDYKDISSMLLLEKVYEMVDSKGYKVVNIDSQIAIKEPKLQKYIKLMKENIGKILHMDSSLVSIKAMSNNGIGPIGKGKACEAFAVCIVEEK